MIELRWMRWEGHVAGMGALRNAYKIWFEILKGRHRFEEYGNIMMNLKEIGHDSVGWGRLTQNLDLR
jgi:hypothetical protein